MRFLFIVPDLVSGARRRVHEEIQRRNVLLNSSLLRRFLTHPMLYTHVVWGGTLNLFRHARVVQKLGAEVAMLSPTGTDTYGKAWGLYDFDYVALKDRRPDDVVIVPDFASDLVDKIDGRVIVYQQVPIHVYNSFDYMSERVTLWTDSPFMLEKCKAAFPGKEIPIVPNVVDNTMFPFVPQAERDAGLILALPRKGPQYIAETRRLYREMGGRYWHFELIDGIPIKALAEQFSRPQAFLASADIEGCALPPQESMAAGVVVIGKNARGANFAMEHGKTAMIGDTPQEAAQALRDTEDEGLRTSISEQAHAWISRYFPENEPTKFWRRNLETYGR
ncbi:MAG: glycosyltransferase [Nannocystaceae bacterium]|nr:glycosyltransferase [Nannocystaceae bacterium]